MTSKTVYPNSYNSSSGGKFQPFKNLKNLHSKSTSNYANTELVHGKKDPLNRPGTVTVSNFKCSLPTGSLVTKVTVYYAHSKVEYNKKVCNIPAPTISLMNDTKVIKYNKSGGATTKTGKAPTTKIVEGSVSFSSAWDYSLFNSSKFGVRINYPTNANNEEGYMRLYYVYVILEYKQPSYSLKCTGSAGNTGYNGDDYTVQMDLSNLNGTRYATSVVLTAPAGFTYQDATGNGTVKKVQNQVYQWTPKMINGTMSIALRFSVNVTFPSGSSSYSGTFTAREQLLGKQSPHTAIITPKPVTPEDKKEEGSPTGNIPVNTPKAVPRINAKKGEQFYLATQFTEEEIANTPERRISYGHLSQYVHYMTLKTFENPNFVMNAEEIAEETPIASADFYVEDNSFYPNQLDSDGNLLFSTYSNIVRQVTLQITSGNTVLRSYNVDIYPENLTTPQFTILSLSDEELNRLGDEVYIVESLMKVSKAYVSDWGNNFRIGVFNNAIESNISTVTIPTDNDSEEEFEDMVIDTTDYDNLTPEEIINNVPSEYWSPALNNPNEYENAECRFHYNKNYPLFIIITGDYPEASTKGTISYAEPCIIEEDYYDGRESNGTYPYPIETTRKSTGDFSELNIESLSTATPIIFYDLPFDTDYGTDETMAIRGIEVSGLIEQNTDDLNIYAKLRSPTGESRTRSLNLDAMDTKVNSENRFSLGGMGDLWGLSTLDIVNLEDWEIEFMVDNTINNNTGTLNFSDVSLTVYISEIDSQNITCKVENEDISYYGAFLKDVEIPEGLKTDVDYLTIDGTDTNDPYRQNIREKEITLKLDIGDNCDLTASTLSLRDLARLFQNKRDKYNRPIPKRIEFSHYPDVYYEYIMENTFDNPIEISSYDDVKIKLTVPSGTAYKKQATSSNKVGYVNGLANVSPVIVVKPTDNILTITETLTEQNFHMGYNGDLTDKVIVIDCEDRIVWLKSDEDDEDGENITYSVDFNSDWFSIIEEYQFDSTGCVIKDVSYIERW